MHVMHHKYSVGMVIISNSTNILFAYYISIKHLVGGSEHNVNNVDIAKHVNILDLFVVFYCEVQMTTWV